MSGLGSIIGGDPEEGKVVTESEMSPEQHAQLAMRRGQVVNLLGPAADRRRASLGLPPLDRSAGGWDEEALRYGLEFLGYGAEGQNPWDLSSAGRNWTGAAQDYISSAWPGLMDNPFGTTAEGGWSNPMLAGMFGEYGDLRNQYATAPEIDFEPTRFQYDPAFGPGTDSRLTLDTGGVGASAGQAGLIDPAYAENAARNLVSRVISPGIAASLASSGGGGPSGRSGAEAEIISQRGTEVALPIARDVLSHESQAKLLNARLQTDASIATAQIQARLKEVQFLKQAEAALQAQLLSARSDMEWNKTMADLETVRGQLQVRSNEIGSQMAQYGLGQGVESLGRGAEYALKSPETILGMMNMGLSAAELPNQLARADQQRLTNLYLAQMGMLPFPGGGKTTSTQFGEENFWDNWYGLHQDYAGLITNFAGAIMGGGQAGGGGGAGGGGMGAGMAMFSTRRVKADITDLPTRETIARDILALPVKAWRYQWEPPARRHIGPILEETPRYLHADDARLDVPSLFGGLIVTAQHLDQRLRALEGGR